MRLNTGALAGALAALAWTIPLAPAAAADQTPPATPSPTLTIIVPFTHGGPTDEIARQLVGPLGKALKQKVVARNILGAGGTLGAEKVAKAKPDGATLLLSNIGQATSPTLYRDLRYDPIGDFEPVGLVAEVPMMLVGRPTLPARTVKELLAHSTTALSYAHAGVGSASHLCGLLFINATHDKPRAIAYQGTQEALSDLMGGHVDLLCDQPTNTLKAVKAGQVRAYGVTSAKRVEALSDVPTLAETGLTQMDLVVWHGFYAPKGTPRQTVERLAAGLRQALADPGLATRLTQLGAVPADARQATPEALRERLKSEAQRWEPILRGAGVRAD